jgi:hypothetical protein
MNRDKEMQRTVSFIRGPSVNFQLSTAGTSKQFWAWFTIWDLARIPQAI